MYDGVSSDQTNIKHGKTKPTNAKNAQNKNTQQFDPMTKALDNKNVKANGNALKFPHIWRQFDPMTKALDKKMSNPMVMPSSCRIARFFRFRYMYDTYL